MTDNVKSLNAEAIRHAERGEFNDAITCLKCAIQLEQENYVLWLNLGITYRDAGKIELAESALKKALDLNPEDITVLETLAVISLNSGDLQEAYNYCLTALELDESNAHVWNTTGVIYFNDSEYEKACEAFEKAVMIDPYYYDALFNLRDTYDELGNTVGKEECIKRMKEIEKKGGVNPCTIQHL